MDVVKEAVAEGSGGFTEFKPLRQAVATHIAADGLGLAIKHQMAKNQASKNFTLAEEIAVALVYNGISHVVLMATPQDLEDLAVGFSLTEGIIAAPSEIMAIHQHHTKLGIEIHIEITARRLHDLQQRRRNLVGATGCGLCGVESLAQLQLGIAKPLLQPAAPIKIDDIFRAFAALEQKQILNAHSHSLHAAAFADRTGEIYWLREDVGRHNALDKLIGAMQAAETRVLGGFVVMTSRCSYELVRKAAQAGIGLLATISAPTARALDEAKAANMGLIALARPDSLKIFCDNGGVTA